jgi:hypothetical protein
MYILVYCVRRGLVIVFKLGVERINLVRVVEYGESSITLASLINAMDHDLRNKRVLGM